MRIGEKIKQRRTELGWSQRELAAKMDYDHSTIGRIERGIIDIPQSRIVQFSEVLRVPIAYLMDWEKPMEMAERHFDMVMDEDLGDIFEDFKKLSPAKKQIVKDLIHTLAETEV